MYTKALDGQIIFYYPHSTLFENVQHISAFMCKNIVSKDGEDLMERFAITDDEEPMFQICLRDTLPSVYESLKVLTHGIDDAFNNGLTGAQLKALDSSLATLPVTDAEKYVVIRTVDHQAYNPNDVGLVDETLQSAIEQGTLADFYTKVPHDTLTKITAAQFTTQITVLARRIIGLRRKSIF